MATRAGPAQVEADGVLALRGGRGHELPLLTKKPASTGSHLQRKKRNEPSLLQKVSQHTDRQTPHLRCVKLR